MTPHSTHGQLQPLESVVANDRTPSRQGCKAGFDCILRLQNAHQYSTRWLGSRWKDVRCFFTDVLVVYHFAVWNECAQFTTGHGRT
ncbi:hypothetical protein TNCT_98411 [Trichonephila clavata]|uniref:Uncharacterized protein n=1 Tax=Trichonephila clavata TaxID=2740835 RepID=A0A8X6HCU6_TRICU|nr:hypothetical protein TNCT_98411 [Trichonephila clavata]